MSISPLDSPLFEPLFGDADTAALFSDTAAIAAMVRVERALARAQAQCGVIPQAAADGISTALDGYAPEPKALAAGTALAGVPVPALLEALRERLEPEAGQWLHWGATSQDIVDTALVLRLCAALSGFAGRLDQVVATLANQSEHYRSLPMAGRTRSQIAAPISFAHRIARWAQPLIALRGDLIVLRPRVARVQFGGAVGTNAAVAPHGPQIAAALAAELDLIDSPPWHTDRTGLAALANWCASLCAALGKMSGDLILMGRSESREAIAGTGGGSSTMPQKANPVAAETVLALARFVAALSTPMHLAAIHAEERDGSAWSVEWLTLPQIMIATGACLRHASALAGTISPDPDRMRAALEIGGGSVLAEAASFLLSQALPRTEAQALVKEAVRVSGDGKETLIEALTRLAPGQINWRAALEAQATITSAQAAADRVFAAVQASDAGSEADD